MARKILISRRDWMQQSGVVFAGGSWPDLPLTNLLDSRPQVVAEAADNNWGSTQFTVDLGYTRKVGLFHFQNLRATALGLMRLRAGTDATFASNNLDTGYVTCWPQDKSPLSFTPWGEYTLTGTMEPEEYSALGLTRVFVPSAVIDCRYIKVEIQDNTADQPFQLGVFGACEVWEPPYNFVYGAGITPMDESDASRVPWGSTHIVERRRRMRFNFGFDALPESEVKTKSLGLAMIKGTSQPLVAVEFPLDGGNLEKTSVYGLMSQAGQISNPYFGRYTQTFQIDQLV